MDAKSPKGTPSGFSVATERNPLVDGVYRHTQLAMVSQTYGSIGSERTQGVSRSFSKGFPKGLENGGSRNGKNTITGNLDKSRTDNHHETRETDSVEIQRSVVTRPIGNQADRTMNYVEFTEQSYQYNAARGEANFDIEQHSKHMQLEELGQQRQQQRPTKPNHRDSGQHHQLHQQPTLVHQSYNGTESRRVVINDTSERNGHHQHQRQQQQRQQEEPHQSRDRKLVKQQFVDSMNQILPNSHRYHLNGDANKPRSIQKLTPNQNNIANELNGYLMNSNNKKHIHFNKNNHNNAHYNNNNYNNNYLNQHQHNGTSFMPIPTDPRICPPSITRPGSLSGQFPSNPNSHAGLMTHDPSPSDPMDFDVDLQSGCRELVRFLRMISRAVPALYDPDVIRNAIRRYVTIWLPLLAERYQSESTGNEVFGEAGNPVTIGDRANGCKTGLHPNDNFDEPEHRMSAERSDAENLCDLDYNLDIIPPVDVEWVWQAHLMSPSLYRNDCVRLTGTVLPHHLRTKPEIDAVYNGSLRRWDEYCLRLVGSRLSERSPAVVGRRLSSSRSSVTSDCLGAEPYEFWQSMEMARDAEDGLFCPQNGTAEGSHSGPKPTSNGIIAAPDPSRKPVAEVSQYLEALVAEHVTFSHFVALPQFTNGEFIRTAISRYKHWLYLLKLYPDVPRSLVPTSVDIIFVMRCHAMYPAQFAHDTVNVLGKCLDLPSLEQCLNIAHEASVRHGRVHSLSLQPRALRPSNSQDHDELTNITESLNEELNSYGGAPKRSKLPSSTSENSVTPSLKLKPSLSHLARLWTATYAPRIKFWRSGCRASDQELLYNMLDTPDIADTQYGRLHIQAIYLSSLPVCKSHVKLRLNYGKVRLISLDELDATVVEPSLNDVECFDYNSALEFSTPDYPLVLKFQNIDGSKPIVGIRFDRRRPKSLFLDLETYSRSMMMKNSSASWHACVDLEDLLPAVGSDVNHRQLPATLRPKSHFASSALQGKKSIATLQRLGFRKHSTTTTRFTTSIIDYTSTAATQLQSTYCSTTLNGNDVNNNSEYSLKEVVNSSNGDDSAGAKNKKDTVAVSSSHADGKFTNHTLNSTERTKNNASNGHSVSTNSVLGELAKSEAVDSKMSVPSSDLLTQKCGVKSESGTYGALSLIDFSLPAVIQTFITCSRELLLVRGEFRELQLNDNHVLWPICRALSLNPEALAVRPSVVTARHSLVDPKDGSEYFVEIVHSVHSVLSLVLVYKANALQAVAHLVNEDILPFTDEIDDPNCPSICSSAERVMMIRTKNGYFAAAKLRCTSKRSSTNHCVTGSEVTFYNISKRKVEIFQLPEASANTKFNIGGASAKLSGRTLKLDSLNVPEHIAGIFAVSVLFLAVVCKPGTSAGLSSSRGPGASQLLTSLRTVGKWPFVLAAGFGHPHPIAETYIGFAATSGAVPQAPVPNRSQSFQPAGNSDHTSGNECGASRYESRGSDGVPRAGQARRHTPSQSTNADTTDGVELISATSVVTCSVDTAHVAVKLKEFDREPAIMFANDLLSRNGKIDSENQSEGRYLGRRYVPSLGSREFEVEISDI